MDYYVLLLRILHIGGAAFWSGAAFLLTGFIAPAVGKAGPVGPQFMQTLVLKTRYLVFISAAAGLTVVAGFLLYLRKLGGLDNLSFSWAATGEGMTFTIGALAGVVAFVVGMMIGSNARKLATFGASLEGPPSPEQGAEIARMQERQQNLGVINAIALVVALLTMSTAQYIFF